MVPYILKKRNLIHIIDLRETVRGLVTAQRLVEAVAERGDRVLLVGTKRQAKVAVRDEAERCGMPYVAERWPGGLLTNFATIRARLDRLVELEGLERTGQIDLYSKKMVSSLRRERRKIERNLGGVRNMDTLPGLLVIVAPNRERLAVKEAHKLGIPTIAWMDTDCDPDGIDVVVPANDDAIGAIQIFLRMVADTICAAGQEGDAQQAAAAQEAQAQTQGIAPVPEDQPDAEPAEAPAEPGAQEEPTPQQ